MVRLLNATEWRPLYHWDCGIVVEERRGRDKKEKEQNKDEQIKNEINGRRELIENREKNHILRSQTKHKLLLQLEGKKIQMFIRGRNPKNFIGLFLSVVRL
jgi:hypothetical protein